MNAITNKANAHLLTDNNTIWDITSTSSSSVAVIGYSSNSHGYRRNNIVVGVSASNGSATCYSFSSTGGAVSNNLSSDSSAPGSSDVTGESAADLFESPTAGSVDLHLKSGAAAIGAGVDIGTTFDNSAGDFWGYAGQDMGPQFDIDNRDRDAEEDTWDIGADQFVASAATGSPAFWMFLD